MSGANPPVGMVHYVANPVAFGNNNTQQNGGNAAGSGEGPASAAAAAARGLLSANSQSFSEIPMQRFSHLWTIKQFNLIPVEMERLCSPWFSPPGSKDLWFLKLRLKAFDENNGNQEFIGVHLFLKESGERKKEVRAHYTISVLDSQGNKRFTGECSKPEGRIFKAGTEGHGYKLLCPRDGIFRPENKLLGDDSSLNIRCEVTVFGDIVNKGPPQEPVSPYSAAEKQSHSLAADMSKLLNLPKGPKGTDALLIAKDGRRLGVHRAVLMARSDYFLAAFEHPMREKESNEVKLDDIESEVLEEMIHFMYTDEVPKLTKLAESLLLVADRFNVMGLKIRCEEYLLQQISVNTVGRLLSYADMANASALRKACIEFTAQHAAEVAQNADFDKNVSKRPYLFKEAFDALAKRQKK